MLLALNPPPDLAQAIPADQFSENRIGLDPLSLSVASMADLQAAVKLFDAKGVRMAKLRRWNRLTVQCWRSATRTTSRWS